MFYRPKQVAEMIGISMRTYHTMVNRGNLHPVKLSERVTVVARREIFRMIEAAIGVELSRSTFSNGKRNVTVKGKENENDKTVNTVSQQATKRTAKDHASVGGIDGVVDTTHIGGIFRSAAALGIDAVLLTRNSCDPLNRRAIRVPMGNIFLIPWT